MSTPLEILKTYWNYDSFRKPQEEIINNLLSGNDIVALLPTGAGKSLCYQIPALMKEGVCLVISPLISLMNDQVENLKKREIKAIALTSALNKEQTISAFDNLLFGNYKFLYISPEKLQSELIQCKINQLNINLIAIDEAHCISEWGHDFRPAYLKIPIIKNLVKHVPTIALTATATERVLKDIVDNLNLEKALVFKQTLFRKNIALNCVKGEDEYYQLKNILNKTSDSVIIYVNSRKKAKDISLVLKKYGFKSSYYHGGLTHDEKHLSFENWVTDKTPIMVATNAFGMGIDKADVGGIIHLDLPFSLENYMQEAGRAGRNGKKAYSFLFVNQTSIAYLKKRYEESKIETSDIKYLYKSLNQFFHITYGELTEKVYDFNIVDFCAHYKLGLLKTYSALKLLERENVIFLDDDPNKLSTLKFTASPNAVLEYSDNNNSELIKTILRNYGGTFEQAVNISETFLAHKININEAKVKDGLNKLMNDGLLTYNFRKNTVQLKFLVPREDNRTINRFSGNIKQQNKIKEDKINAVIDFAKNTTVCRSKLLLKYFGEKLTENCNICDVCTKSSSKKINNNKEILDKILILFEQHSALSVKEIVSNFDEDKPLIISKLQLLLDTNKISINSQNKLELIA